MLDPFSWALDAMREMAVLALLTSAIYAAVSSLALRGANRAIDPIRETQIAANHALDRSDA